MSAVLHDVLPVFLMILAGWLTVRTGLLNAATGEALGEFVFRVAVPMLLFRTIAHADVGSGTPVRLWLAYFSGVTVAWTLGHLVATRLFGRDRRIGVISGVSSAFANNVFIGLPLVERVVGDRGIVAVSVLLAVHLPVMMIAGTVLMEEAVRRETGERGRGVAAICRQTLLNLVQNPLVIGLLGGALLNLSGLALPAMLDTMSKQIAGIAGPAALLSLGMALRRYGLSGNIGLATAIAALKLMLLPACVWLSCQFLGLNPQWTAAMVLTSSVPTGVNAWLIANRFGAGQGLAASAITLSTLLGVLTVTFWAALAAPALN
nr:AEC family transporter [uncultured Gellertiella sp.]